MSDVSRLHTVVCDMLGCEIPILLAGMGGVARSELAIAVARAGGFPTLGMVRESPQLIASEVAAYRRGSDRPFAVNLIPAATDRDLLTAQMETCLELGVTIFSFFWDVVPEAVARAKRAGCTVLHQVGTLECARDAEAAGADILIAQGVEAGGHVHGRTGTFTLGAALIGKTELPVVLSGGITTGTQFAEALELGACGIQCGTAFLATHEAFAHDYHKQRLIDASAEDTVLTDAFVLNWPAGAAVRVLNNSVTKALGPTLIGHDPSGIRHEIIAHDEGIPRLLQSTDSPLRTTTGELERMPLYAGMGVGTIREIGDAGDRLQQFCIGAIEALSAQPESIQSRRSIAWKS